MQLNFSRGALFHMKTRVSLRYFVTDCGSTLCPHYQPHCKLPFAFNLKNLLQFHYPVTYMTEIRELQKICFFPCLLNHCHWDIRPLVLHHFQFGYVDTHC